MGKEIMMKVERCGNDGWHEDGFEKFVRASRWIKVNIDYNPSKRNRLWDYVRDGFGRKPSDEDFCKDESPYLDYFTWRKRNYAIEQFLALGNPFWMPESYSYVEAGQKHWISGVDGEDIYNPIYIEMDEYGERLRVYEKVI